jgi:hypothetical protein
MKLSHDLVLNIAFTVLPVIIAVGYLWGLLRTGSDLFFSLIAIVTSILIVGFDEPLPTDIAHFLYCGGFIIPVAIVSQNPFLLALNAAMIVGILISRYYFRGCIINRKQKQEGFFTSVSKMLHANVPFWDWKYIFPGLLVISSVRLGLVLMREE